MIGFLGVTLLVWNKLGAGTGSTAIATLAAVIASFCYGFAAVLAKKRLADVSPMAVAGGSMCAASLVLLPVSFWLWPAQSPSLEAWSMAIILGVAFPPDRGYRALAGDHGDLPDSGIRSDLLGAGAG